jgi:hypothetical protein
LSQVSDTTSFSPLDADSAIEFTPAPSRPSAGAMDHSRLNPRMSVLETEQGSAPMPVSPIEATGFGVHGLAGDGVGRYGAAGLPDATANADGTLTLLRGYQAGPGNIRMAYAEIRLIYECWERNTSKSAGRPTQFRLSRWVIARRCSSRRAASRRPCRLRGMASRSYLF